MLYFVHDFCWCVFLFVGSFCCSCFLFGWLVFVCFAGCFLSFFSVVFLGFDIGFGFVWLSLFCLVLFGLVSFSNDGTISSCH